MNRGEERVVAAELRMRGQMDDRRFGPASTKRLAGRFTAEQNGRAGEGRLDSFDLARDARQSLDLVPEDERSGPDAGLAAPPSERDPRASAGSRGHLSALDHVTLPVPQRMERQVEERAGRDHHNCGRGIEERLDRLPHEIVKSPERVKCPRAQRGGVRVQISPPEGCLAGLEQPAAERLFDLVAARDRARPAKPLRSTANACSSSPRNAYSTSASPDSRISVTADTVSSVGARAAGASPPASAARLWCAHVGFAAADLLADRLGRGPRRVVSLGLVQPAVEMVELFERLPEGGRGGHRRVFRQPIGQHTGPRRLEDFESRICAPRCGEENAG